MKKKTLNHAPNPQILTQTLVLSFFTDTIFIIFIGSTQIVKVAFPFLLSLTFSPFYEVSLVLVFIIIIFCEIIQGFNGLAHILHQFQEVIKLLTAIQVPGCWWMADIKYSLHMAISLILWRYITQGKWFCTTIPSFQHMTGSPEGKIKHTDFSKWNNHSGNQSQGAYMYIHVY